MASGSKHNLNSIGMQARVHGPSEAPTCPLLGTAIRGAALYNHYCSADMLRASCMVLPVLAVLYKQQR